MSYHVVMTQPDGHRTVLARTRRYNGAVAEQAAAVASKRGALLKHANGDRVIVGPTGNADEVAVVLLADTDYVYRYSIEPD